MNETKKLFESRRRLFFSVPENIGTISVETKKPKDSFSHFFAKNFSFSGDDDRGFVGHVFLFRLSHPDSPGEKERKLFWSNCFCFDEKRFWTEIFEAGNLKPFSESILVSQLEINFRTLSVELNFSNLFFFRLELSAVDCPKRSEVSNELNLVAGSDSASVAFARTRTRAHNYTWNLKRTRTRPTCLSPLSVLTYKKLLFRALPISSSSLSLSHSLTRTHTHAHTLSIVLALPFIGFPTLTSTSTLPRTPQHTLTHVLWTPPDDSACSRLLLHIRYLSLSLSASQLRLNERNFTHFSGFSSLPIFIFNISARSSDFQRNATCASSSS